MSVVQVLMFLVGTPCRVFAENNGVSRTICGALAFNTKYEEFVVREDVYGTEYVQTFKPEHVNLIEVKPDKIDIDVTK